MGKLRDFLVNFAQISGAGGPQAFEQQQLAKQRLALQQEQAGIGNQLAQQRFEAQQSQIAQQSQRQQQQDQLATQVRQRRSGLADMLVPQTGPPVADLGGGGALLRELILSGNAGQAVTALGKRNAPKKLPGTKQAVDINGKLSFVTDEQIAGGGFFPVPPKKNGNSTAQRRLATNDMQKRISVLLGAAPELSKSGNGFGTATQDTVDALAVAATPIAQKLVLDGVGQDDAMVIAIEQVLSNNIEPGNDGGFFGGSVAPSFKRGTPWRTPTRKQAGGGSDLSRARAAIAKGATRDAVRQRLIEAGIDPKGL